MEKTQENVPLQRELFLFVGRIDHKVGVWICCRTVSATLDFAQFCKAMARPLYLV